MAIILVCVPHPCIPAAKKATDAGNIQSNTTTDMSIYENVNKKASKLRHAPRQARQARQSQAKPGIEGKLSLIEAL